MQTENTYVETDLGNIALNLRGEYSDETSYEYLDTVSYKGGSYVCLAELAKTTSGIAPEPGKNTEHWQMLALPGGLTSDYIAMHDDVVNKAKQVETSRTAVELSQQEVEAAQADVSQMWQDTQEASEEAAASRDSAAGYAQSAEASRTAAAESEQNINAQVTGFDTHVAEKTSAAESAIIEARQTAVNTVSAKQGDAVQAVTGEGNKQIKNVEDAGTEQVGKVKSAGASAVSTAGAAGVSAVNAVKTQQTASIKVVADKGTQQVTAVNTAGSTQASIIETKGADQVKAIQEAGENALQNISNGVDKGLSEEGKAADAKATGEAISKLTKDLTSKADKTALVKTDRKLDALWKLNQGISYEFQTDDTEAYQKTVPSGAKMASVKSIGGKTIVWNQLITKQNESEHNYGLDFTWLDNGKIKISGTSIYTDGDANVCTILNSIEATAGHKYLFKLTGTDSFYILGYGIGESTAQTQKLIFEPQDSGTENLAICGIKEKIQSGTVIDDVVCPQIFDLTQMFGSGNEPSAPEEFEAMFPADYYPYNAGELMSAPVNEIVEQGRNLFDCYGFSCTGIPDINAKRDIANDYGTTISTIDSTNRLIVTQNKVGDSATYSYKNGYLCIGIRGLKCNTKYELAFDFTPTKILIANPVMKILVNGNAGLDEGSTGVEFSLNVKKHVTIKISYEMNDDIQFLELRNAGMSGIIENFQIEEGTTVATYSPYHQNTYSIHKAIIDLDGYGWSAGNVRNEVDWENKQYIQRVGKYTIDGSEIIFKENKYWVMTVTDFEKPKPSTKNAICVNFKVTDGYSGKWGSIIFRQGSDGFVFMDIGSKFANENEVKDYFQQNNETIYYELNEEQIIDISDIIDNTFQEPIEVEAGGTLIFKNSNGDNYRIPVPSTEEYLVSLAEVTK